MGAVPVLALACGTWFPPDVLGVSGYSSKRPWRVRQPGRWRQDLDRKALRSRLRAERRAFAAGRHAFPIRHEAEPLLRAASCVGLYCATSGEANLCGWANWCAVNGARTALPRLADRTAPMEFALWKPGDALLDSGMGFAQPVPSAPSFEPDLICVPMLGFDRRMNRLGQGAGHFDRYFSSRSSALRVGIAWSIQEVSRIAAEPWDIPMDAICTESEWICPPGSRIAAQ
jgi:5-formyltetrahydrofolate cyclo-ligase